MYKKICFMPKLALCSKTNCFQSLSVSDKMCSIKFFLQIQSNWVKSSKKFTIICKKQIFLATLKFGFLLAAIWAFIFWMKCDLRPLLIIAAKQDWCHFDGNECIFHLSWKIFRSFNQLTRNRQNRAFPNLWGTL